MQPRLSASPVADGRGLAVSVHEDGDAGVKDCGDPQQVAIPGVRLAGLDALKRAPVDAGDLCESLLRVVGVEA